MVKICKNLIFTSKACVLGLLWVEVATQEGCPSLKRLIFFTKCQNFPKKKFDGSKSIWVLHNDKNRGGNMIFTFESTLFWLSWPSLGPNGHPGYPGRVPSNIPPSKIKNHPWSHGRLFSCLIFSVYFPLKSFFFFKISTFLLGNVLLIRQNPPRGGGAHQNQRKCELCQKNCVKSEKKWKIQTTFEKIKSSFDRLKTIGKERIG